MTIGSTLKEIRLSKGLKRVNVCNDTNISLHTLRSYENGQRKKVNNNVIIKLSDYYNISLTRIMK